MITILFMVAIALGLSGFFVAGYLWALSRGQFDDLQTPALRILKDDLKNINNSERNENEKRS